VNAAVGAWLMLSSLLTRGLDASTFWNHLLVGFALVLFAMAGSLHSLRRRRADL
jgi:cytosine/uracil/thiamine/allantoin permease